MKVLASGLVSVGRRLALIAALVVAAGVAASAPGSSVSDLRLAQADSGERATSGSAPDLQGIGLTAAHKRLIYENAADEPMQAVPGDSKPEVGITVPDAVILNEVPIAVKDQVGLLRDFKLAKVQGDHVVIVDPASRKIVDVITKEEGGGN